MDYGHYALLLLAVGLAILAVEVFIPSGGVLAVFTLLCLAASVTCAVWEWWGTNPVAFWAYVGGVAVLIPATLTGALVMLPRTTFGRRLLQEAPEPGETDSFVRERAELAAMLGHRGVSVTPLYPGGMVEVDGRRMHAEARGLMLDPGQPVEVIGRRGNRLLVRLADDPAPPSALRGPDEIAEPAGPPPVAPVIVPAPNRPGGSISPDAPVGYSDGPNENGPVADPASEDEDVSDEDTVISDPFAADAAADEERRPPR